MESAIQERGCLHFSLRLYPWESYNSNYSLPSFGWIVGHTGFFNFSLTAVLGEWNLWIQTSVLPLNIDRKLSKEKYAFGPDLSEGYYQ